MVELYAFRRLLRVVALALCSAAIVASASPASARSHHHGAGRHARAYHAGHHARHYHAHRHYRHIGRASRGERGVAQMQARGLADSQASVAPTGANIAMTAPASFGSSGVVAEARRYLGGNPTGRGSLWCARFMNLVLQHSGYRGTGSDMARSFASYGQRVSGPQVGAIAVMGRGRGGGHVGIITGIDAKGNPIMISGNNGNRVKEAPISRGRIYAYVMPSN
jgi:uncharacterized protein (TIGR02594 family)